MSPQPTSVLTPIHPSCPLPQPFQVAEVFTGTPGKYVDLENTISGFKGILNGKYDDLPEMAFYMVGDIKEVIEKADRMAKELAQRKEAESGKKDAKAGQVNINENPIPHIWPGAHARLPEPRQFLSPKPYSLYLQELKDVPSLDKLVADIKEEAIDLDDKLEEDFKAEKISAETVVLNEDGKQIPLPNKTH